MRRDDPDGATWKAEAAARWSAAELEAAETGESPITYYIAPALPSWSAPAFVARELLGRYLYDRDTGVVHDVANALEGCGIDGIRNATFVHFAAELEGTLPADVVDCACMGGAS